MSKSLAMAFFFLQCNDEKKTRLKLDNHEQEIIHEDIVVVIFFLLLEISCLSTEHEKNS